MASEDQNHEWVTNLLSASADVAMPEHIAERIEAALQAQAQQRVADASVDEAKRSYLEMGRRSALGTFGENVPSHYDRSGVGIDVDAITAHQA